MRNKIRRVRVSNVNASFGVNVKLVEAVAEKLLRSLKRDRNSEIDIVFTDDVSIRKLNRRYKQEDSSTDVLSFGLDGRAFLGSKILGEIFISLDTARRNSRLFGVGLEEEAMRYVVHGMLHLFGYDDCNSSEKARMWHRQEKLLGDICRREDLSKVLTRR